METRVQRKLIRWHLQSSIEREVIDLHLGQKETYEMRNLYDCHLIKNDARKEYRVLMVCFEHYSVAQIVNLMMTQNTLI